MQLNAASTHPGQPPPDEPSPGVPDPSQTRRTVSRIMWFFAIVYVVEGIGQAKSGVIWQPLAYFLKHTQGWDAVKISVSLAVLDLPWIIKPLYGALSDFVPLFGYRRRYYLIVANSAAVLAFGWVAMISTPAALVPALTVTAFAMAISSTLCGALLVQAGQRHDASASFINQQWLWYNIAQMAAVLVAGYLIEILSPVGALHAAAWIAAVAPLSIIASIWLVHEPRARLDLAALRQRLGSTAVSVPHPQPVARRRLPVPLLFQPGLRHAALLPDERPVELLAGLHRRAGFHQRRRLDPGRFAVSMEAASGSPSRRCCG